MTDVKNRDQNQKNHMKSGSWNNNLKTKSGDTNYQVADEDMDAHDKVVDEIKKTWNQLSDEDIKMYETNPDKFFDNVRSKQGITREEASQKLKMIKFSAGSGSNKPE